MPRIPAQTRVEPLNQRTIRGATARVRQYVQNQKVEISQVTITKQQYAQRWPDEYNSFVGTERLRNQYKDPQRFYRVMLAKPEWYAKRFIFRPKVDVANILKDAIIYTVKNLHLQSQRYGYRTGFYGSSFEVLLNGSRVQSLQQLEDDIDQNAVAEIFNKAPYASTIDARAFEFNKINGVMYYAAERTARKWPELGVRFDFLPSAVVRGADHKYFVPHIKLGPRELVVDKLTKPGKKIRSRARKRRRR